MLNFIQSDMKKEDLKNLILPPAVRTLVTNSNPLAASHSAASLVSVRKVENSWIDIRRHRLLPVQAFIYLYECCKCANMSRLIKIYLCTSIFCKISRSENQFYPFAAASVYYSFTGKSQEWVTEQI